MPDDLFMISEALCIGTVYSALSLVIIDKTILTKTVSKHKPCIKYTY